MHRIGIGILGLCAVLAAVPAAARGLGEAGELEHARANARAGGPLNERDAELLERHGCLSGTENAFCKKLSHPRRNAARAREREREIERNR